MLTLPRPVLIATVAVDMRRGHDGLAAMAREYMQREVLDGGLFVFFNKRVDRLKALWWDETGYCLLYKRIEQGRFRVPQPLHVGTLQVEVDVEELALILRGVRLVSKKRHRRKKPST